MTRSKTLALTLLGALLAGGSLVAQETTTPKRERQVERRADRQQKRIDQGVKNGSLTPKEAANTERHEAKLQKDISKAEADGKITKKEQKQLNREENRDSRRIYRKKHNARHQ